MINGGVRAVKRFVRGYQVRAEPLKKHKRDMTIFVDGLAPGLKSIHPESIPEAPIGYIVKKANEKSPKTGDATHFRHGENGAAGVPLFGSRTGPMGTKLAHVQFNSSRSNFAQRMSLDLRREGVVLVSCRAVHRNAYFSTR